MSKKNYRIAINGEEYMVEVEEIRDGMLSSRSVVAAAPDPAKKVGPTVSAGEEKILAPLQGGIFDIKVKSGQQVKAGDELLIIEAMKMENEVVSPRDAEVVSIHVNKGDSVSADDLLVVIK